MGKGGPFSLNVTYFSVYCKRSSPKTADLFVKVDHQ